VALAAAAVVGSSGVATAAPTGSVSGQVWFDRDRDRTRDVGEPGRTGAGVIQLYRAGVLVGAYDTDEDGRYTVTGLAPGIYRLTYTDANRYLPTTPSAVNVTVGARPRAVVNFGMKGASIAGEQWLDADFDGLWNTGEQVLPSFTVVNPTYVTGPAFEWSQEDDHGRFRIEDLPSGAGYVVHVLGPLGLPLTKEGGDSVVDWSTGESAPLALAPGEDVTGIDAGYAQVAGDSAITAARIDPDRTQFQVGETFTVELTLTNNGPVPNTVGIEMVWPTGLELVDTEGLTTTFGPGVLYGDTLDKLAPGTSRTFTAVMKATSPIANGAIDVTTSPSPYGDDNPQNNHASFPIQVA
jgi:hypothetical protein